MKKGVPVVLGIVALLVVFGVATYNGLVGKDQAVDKEWAEVSNQYQRRADLVPNLVKTVQGSADFEKSTLDAVVQARASAGRVNVNTLEAPDSPETLQEYQQAQNQFGSALQRLLVVVERYPDLKASAGFRDLQAQLEGTENRIAVARGRFNEAAQAYNTAIRKVPAVFVAGLMGFDKKPYFEAETGAEKAPEVDFGGSGAAQ